MVKPKIDQIFAGGLNSDNDVQMQPPNTYRNSINGRIIFNEDGTYAWQNDKGNSLSFTLTEYNGDVLTGYQPIGWAEFSDKVVIFSTDGTNSEVGYVVVLADGTSNYTQIFNDKYDFNQDTLDFHLNNSIEAIAVKETDDIERVYWCDGVKTDSNERRCISINGGDSFNYTPTAGFYPYWWSVHSMDRYCQWQMGRIKFVQRIDGALKTGVFQYSYRQGTKDGYRTQWYPLTKHIFLNSQEISSTDSNEYQMQPSNIVTQYGIEIELTGLDRRFPILDVAYVYSIDEEATVEAGIFAHIDYGDTLPAASVVLDHTSHGGDPVTLDDFNIRPFPVRKVRTIEEKDNRLFEGNITEVGVLEPDLTLCTLTPFTRLMTADCQSTSKNNNPFSHTQPVTETLTVQSYTGATESHEIINDYANYKGMQWEHLFTSYWAGETYRFGVLLFDGKGMPNYVFHLQDYTFPERYDPSGDFTLTKLETAPNCSGSPDVYKINLLGLQVDNLVIPADILYDENGKLNVSGFAIVRAKRVPSILFQGLIQNTVWENSDTEEGGIARWQYTRPLSYTTNEFTFSPTLWVAGSEVNNAENYINVDGRSGVEYANRASTFLMYSPDFLFGYETIGDAAANFEIDTQVNDRIHLIANAVAQNDLEGDVPIENDVSVCHYLSKNYNTELTDAGTGITFPYTYQNLGDKSFVERVYKTALSSDSADDIANYDVQNANLIFTQYVPLDPTSSYVNCTDCSDAKYGWGLPSSLLLLLKDFKNLGSTKQYVAPHPDAGNIYLNSQFIANYTRPNDNYYGGTDENSLEKTIYISTGHFQPITADVIADVQQPNGDLLFSGIEVWGGDNYPSFFDFTRILPQYSNCANDGTCYNDYAVSVIVPLESNINYAMRYGRQFAKDGTEWEATSCGGGTDYDNGIQSKQREDFNINGVLMHEENVQFYNAKPYTITNRQDNPLTVIYSETKYYGESIDNYRLNLPNSYLDLNGSNGDVIKLFSQYSYIYFLQRKGFGRLYINQATTLNSPDTGNIIIGSGGVLTGALYISETIGCQHQFSVTTGHNNTYWIDANLGKMYRFTQNGLQPISDIKGLHNKIFTVCKYYRTQNDLFDCPQGRGGIHGVYDYKNNELVMTFRRVKTRVVSDDLLLDDTSLVDLTVVYNDMGEIYTTYFNIYPKFYFSHKNWYFSTDNDNPENVYSHLTGDRGEYYGVIKDSSLEIIVQPSMEIQKVYDGCMMNVNTDGASILGQCAITTDVNTISLSLNTDPRVRYRHGMLWFPVRGTTQTDRVRGKWMSMDFTVGNTADKLCRITMIENKFRAAYAI